MMSAKSNGKLIIIGGHEEKEGEAVILQAVYEEVDKRKGHLLIVTVAT
jgi:cyanophycinase-like exopeptidase